MSCRIPAPLLLLALMAGLVAGEAAGLTLRAPGMEVQVAASGRLAGLRLAPAADGRSVEALWPMARTATGGLHGAGPVLEGVELAGTVRADGADAVVVEGPEVAMRFVCGAQGLSWTVENRSSQGVQVLIALAPAASAVRDPAGRVRRAPAIGLWTSAAWIIGDRILRIGGIDRAWGASSDIGQDEEAGRCQIVEADLPPGSRRVITLVAEHADADDQAAALAVAPPATGARPVRGERVVRTPAASGDLRLLSPRDHQVVQRRTRASGSIPVAGDLRLDADRIEARVAGGPAGTDWQPLPYDPLLRSFRGELPAPAGGWYRVEVRASKGGQPVGSASVAQVGVGEVFIVTGQGGAANMAGQRQRSISGLVASFAGDDWRPGDDPQLGTMDGAAGGSIWPCFGDALAARLRVPVGVAVVAAPGEPASSWRPGGPAFVWLAHRLAQLGPGGHRAILWQMGEGDVGCDAGTWHGHVAAAIGGLTVAGGRKPACLMAQTSCVGPALAAQPGIRSAQARLLAEGLAIPGPDLDGIVGEDRNGWRFTPSGLRRAGELWADSVSAYLDRVLD